MMYFENILHILLFVIRSHAHACSVNAIQLLCAADNKAQLEAGVNLVMLLIKFQASACDLTHVAFFCTHIAAG